MIVALPGLFSYLFFAVVITKASYVEVFIGFTHKFVKPKR